MNCVGAVLVSFLTPTPFLFSLPVDIVRLPGKVPLLPCEKREVNNLNCNYSRKIKSYRKKHAIRFRKIMATEKKAG